MKKRALLTLLTLALLLLLAACALPTPGGGKDDEESPEEKTWEKMKISYFHPDENERVFVEGLFVDGELTEVDLDPEKITFKNRHMTFAGLFTEREGGTKVIDAKGKRVPGTEMTRNNVYYVQGVGLPVAISGVFVGTLSAPLPKSINYGDAFPTSLPIPQLEGEEAFLGWYEQGVGYITGPDGVVLEQYRKLSSHHSIQVTLDWYTSEITSRKITLIPKYSAGVNAYYDVTFAYNDGTYRESVLEVLPGTPYADITMPEGAGEMREIVAWSLDPNEYVRPVGNLVGNVTLYAVWKDYRYACVITALGDERVEKVYEGDTLTLAPPPPRTGYTFGGWYDNELYLGSDLQGTVTYGSIKECYWALWIKN